MDQFLADSIPFRGKMQHEWLWILAVLLLFGLPLFVGLGAPEMGNDEAIYSFAVRHIVHHGGWLTPRAIYDPLNPPPFVEKPPLKLWITAAGIRWGLLPENQFGLRFFDAIFGVLCLVYIFKLGCRISGPVPGFISALLFFTLREPVFIHGFRSNNMDSILMLSYAGAIFHFLAWTEAGSRRLRSLQICAVMGFFILAFMSKFVAALFLPLILGVACLCIPAWRAAVLKDRRVWMIGALLSLVVVAPWFIYQQMEMGSKFWGIILQEQVIRRVTISCDPAHIRPWFFYAIDLGRSFLRSGAILVVAPGVVWLSLVSWKEKWAIGWLMLLWAGLPFLLLSTFTAKLSHYLYPYMIPLALAGGIFTPVAAEAAAGRKSLCRAAIGAGLVVACVVLFRGPGFMEYLRPFCGGWLGPAAAIVVVVGAALLRPPLKVILILVLLAGPVISWGRHMERILGKPYTPVATLDFCLTFEDRNHNGGLVLKPEGVTLLHTWAYYGNLPIAENDGLERVSPNLRLDPPKPIWMSMQAWTEALSHQQVPEGYVTLEVPHLSIGVSSSSVLLLPTKFSSCAAPLIAQGARPLKFTQR